VFKLKSDAKPSGLAQNNAAENPNAEVGITRGISIKVSRSRFPRKLYLASIQAIGRPAIKSTTVTTAANAKEISKLLRIRLLTSGVLRTYTLMSPQPE